jgi:flagellar biosynthesis/type III secretory pathway protein FliH
MPRRSQNREAEEAEAREEEHAEIRKLAYEEGLNECEASIYYCFRILFNNLYQFLRYETFYLGFQKLFY